MPGDLQEEFSILSGVGKLTFRWPPKWKSTEDEWPGVEGQVLGSFLPLVSDEVDSFQLLEAALCNSDGRQRRLDGSE
ncbi:MAG TPA: hypothetical protein VMT20_22170 [Terriglobia bacterium]|nr:hypothetical protein [Terriglobia bacterium]